MAILPCLSHHSHLPPKNKYILFTDSLSSLSLITDTLSDHPLAQRIQLVLSTIASIDSSVTFLGHIEFHSHDVVDSGTKRATTLDRITDKCPLSEYDYRNHHCSLIKKNDTHSGRINTTTNYLELKRHLPWTSSNRPVRSEQTVLTRLRIGHTRPSLSSILRTLSARRYHGRTHLFMSLTPTSPNPLPGTVFHRPSIQY